ncbi:MAG: DNA repair protein RadC [Chitinophagaceae bacterium]|nr:DNA repair protein RadC [Chitinophagaceae bacterium]
MPKIAIKNWASDDQPREKLLLKGAETLSTTELLAIIINTGNKQHSAVEIAKEMMLHVHNNLQNLGNLSVDELINLKIKGLGKAKSVSIVAALELGIRRNMARVRKSNIKQSSDVAVFLQAELGHKQMETFVVLYLNRSNNIIQQEVISEGGITGTVADPRIILKKALDHHAVSIILCHNHPSGNLKPSKADELLTSKIKNAAAFLDIQVMDHIIVSEEGYYSFADEGMM